MRSLSKILFRRPQLWASRISPALGQKSMFKYSAHSNNFQNGKLKTIPLQNYKANQSEIDSKVEPSDFCLFSSIQPIFPNNPMNCQIKIGNLKRITKPLLYSIISPDNGEIFTIGIALNKSVEKNLNAELKFLEQGKENGNILINDPMSNTFNLDIISKQKNYRFKITKIEMTPDGIFAQGIPYKDRPLTQAEQIIDIQHEIRMVNSLVQQIRKLAQYDRVEVFSEVKYSLLDSSEKLTPNQVDELVFQIAAGLSKLLTNNLKMNTSNFVQQLLESQTYIDRLFILRKQLENMSGILDLVNKHFKEADSSLLKLHQQTLAKLATEYIRQNYLKDASQSQQYGGTAGTQQFSGDKQSSLVKKYFDKLSLIADESSREKVKREIERFSLLDKQSSEFHKINSYLDEVFSIPFQKFSPVQWDIQFAKDVLDKEIEGLEKVKERIVEMISVNKLKNAGEKAKGFILLLNGPPGTGKTSIAKSIAKALKRTSRFISCAGVADPTFFKGHKRTYVDSMPGVFIRELIKSNTMNPVFILDELDKVSKHHSGGADPYYTLLEILNPEENHNFTDHYMDISVDFSHVIFILTSNDTLQMLEPLKNRLETIDIQAYIQEEKLQIATNFLVKKSIETNGIEAQMIKYDEQALTKIIKAWCYQESGVRELKRCLEKIARKHATNILASNPNLCDKVDELNQVVFDPTTQSLDLTKDQNLELISQYLGPPAFDIQLEQRSIKKFPPGQVNILTVGGMIGHVLTVESCFDLSETEKKGQIQASGNIKLVLQESLKLAKINAFKFLNEEQKKKLQNSAVHMHFTEGATPKDGPSAGTAITTALLSLVMNVVVPSNLGMTGEISLNGQVCKIGGLQQKLIAAKTLDIVDIILPYANLGDALNLPQQLIKGLNLYFVTDYRQIYELIFEQQLANNNYTINKIKNGVYETDQNRTKEQIQCTINY
ncbi:unnamed protein product (macronuclear) [Paramecium tetraurelia]|uniref:Lon proteolytic domain-containing protein n=1 Tax=Paramecium tetraurelia TaxID=5888 RepID=A0CDH3_PARTE|nr:uncharacterized protein GSPATT00007051001 [Paramecium tetraurelia]CAK68840.1 unnamed protein product [Paramecium tetraurelia]|eukprot:XP_001436237.1 hypothetical protein (macronuclear) [Paramecium tetraurelia strain d4-2]